MVMDMNIDLSAQLFIIVICVSLMYNANKFAWQIIFNDNNTNQKVITEELSCCIQLRRKNY